MAERGQRMYYCEVLGPAAFTKIQIQTVADSPQEARRKMNKALGTALKKLKERYTLISYPMATTKDTPCEYHRPEDWTCAYPNYEGFEYP